MPRFAQLVVADPERRSRASTSTGGRRSLRKRAERESSEQGCGLYIASLSSRTMTYKGMLTTDQLALFFPDLRDERPTSAIAMVHSRFSTNTFPSWPLAHPYRTMAHNGEINTIRGNRNRMRAREALLGTDLFPGDLQRAMPVCPEEVSDSASFDEVLELLCLGGRPMPHAVMMMMPEAWENHAEMPADQREFYQFHSSLMEPWDGPACVTFTDGTIMGATLDRNGLRPARWWHLTDDRVVLASESGVLAVDPARSSPRAGCAPAGCSSSTPAPARSSTTTPTSPSWPPPSRTGVAARRAGAPRRAALPRARRPHPLLGGAPPADLRLHRGGAADPARADGDDRRRAAG